MNNNNNNNFQKEQRQRWGVVLFLSLVTVVYNGAIFGWGPMQLLLEENGSFSSKCDDDDNPQEICPAQTSALVSIQFYALFSQILSPLLGAIMDRYGKTVMANLMAGTSWTGLVLLVIAVEYVDVLLYPAFIGIALGAWMGALLLIPSGLLFGREQTRARVIITLNALFDAGSATYLALWGMGQLIEGITLTHIAIGYFILSLVLFGGVSHFTRVAKPAEETKYETTKSNIMDETCGDVTEHVRQSMTSVLINDDNEEEHHDDEGEPSHHPGKEVFDEDHVDCKTQQEEEEQELATNAEQYQQAQSQTRTTNDDATTRSGDAYPEKDYVLVAERTQRQQLTCWPFLLLAIFWTVQVSLNQWITTTQRDFLAFLGDDELNNKYLNIFSMLLPASLVFVPFTDAMIVNLGYPGSFQVINAMSVVFSLIRLLSSNLNVQVVGFLVFSFYRSMLFGVTFSFMPTLFGSNVVGKASGILFTVTGVTALMNVPLSSWAIEGLGGDFFIPDLIYTVLLGPCIVVSYLLGRVVSKEQKVKEGRSIFVKGNVQVQGDEEKQ